MAIRFSPYNKSTPFAVPDYATAAARDRALESQNQLGMMGLGAEGVKGYNYLADNMTDPDTGLKGRTFIADALRDMKNTVGKDGDIEGAGAELDALLGDEELFGVEDATVGSMGAGSTEPDMLGMAMEETPPQFASLANTATTGDLASNTTTDLLRDSTVDLIAPVGTDVVADVGANLAADLTTDVASDVTTDLVADAASSTNIAPYMGFASGAAAFADGNWGKGLIDTAGGVIDIFAPSVGSAISTGLNAAVPTEGNAERNAQTAQQVASNKSLQAKLEEERRRRQMYV